MIESQPGLTAREWDLAELPTGEILTVVGTYRGEQVRGRLTYRPDDDGDVEIFGRRYRKTSYEISGQIPLARQVLALPGESHYVIRAGDLKRHYPAVALPTARPEVAELAASLAAAEIPVAVGGSRALNAARSESDYDLVIYGRHNVEPAARVITGLDGYEPCLHFGFEFVRDKYRHFTKLTPGDLKLLVADRWRHFVYRGLPMSVDGCEEDLPADIWLEAMPSTREAGHVEGAVLDGSQCYDSPKIIDVQTEHEIVRVFTWLNLYAGALRSGDHVAVHGRWVVIRGERFLLVEDSTHAIRVLSRLSTNPV